MLSPDVDIDVDIDVDAGTNPARGPNPNPTMMEISRDIRAPRLSASPTPNSNASSEAHQLLQ